MTTWAARSIAKFARDGGFYGDDVKVATAIALAATGGHDHYDMRAGVPGSGHWMGLWAIDADEHPDLVARDLLDPYAAARAAKQLTDDADGFDWSPVWRNGSYRTLLEHAGVESGREPFTEHTAPHNLTSGGSQWPSPTR
jgi:Lysozyme like domain